jgi:hypothetical protein
MIVIDIKRIKALLNKVKIDVHGTDKVAHIS